MKEYSDITQRWYEPDECVFFRNPTQSAHYIAWGATLYDLFVDSQNKLVFCFSKDDHNKLKKRWGINRDNIYGGLNG